MSVPSKNFALRSKKVGKKDIVAYFVRSITEGDGSTLNGCATHPVNVPGIAIASIGSQWTLSHETGHCLGLPHCDTKNFCMRDRLMTAVGTGVWNSDLVTNPPPDSVESEILLLHNSRYVERVE